MLRFCRSLFPTGVEPSEGGAYIAASTELLHLKDTDGDGKADESRVVLSGFGTEDTHHILRTLRWGPDGMLDMNQSVYIHSHIETPHGVRRLNAGGIWQFRPETMRLEVFARGFVNAWAHAFDDYGVSFATDGAKGFSIFDCRFSIEDYRCQMTVAAFQSKIKNRQSKISPTTSPSARST